MDISKDIIYQKLKTVTDPELGVNIVDLGLIYDVAFLPEKKGTQPWVKILMTLTSPGCPMITVFDRMVKDALFPLKEINVDKDVQIELTFDPPWVPDMMSEEARAELGI